MSRMLTLENPLDIEELFCLWAWIPRLRKDDVLGKERQYNRC